MTTFAGSISQFVSAGALPGQVASRPTRADPAHDGLTPFLIPSPHPGALTKHQPTALLSRSLVGHRARSYLDDFYFQIYYIPSPINFGFLGVTSTQGTIIWNANFNNETIESVTTAGFDGLTLSTPTLPYVMHALQQHEVDVTASIVGPIIIDATITFTFSPTTFVPALDVIGTRAEIWPLPINWRDSVKVTLEYKTDIIRSRNEHEQRRAIRQTPRKTIEFTSTAMNNDDVRTLHQFLATVQPITIIVPEPGMHAYLSADALGTDEIIFVALPVPLWILPTLTIRIDYGSTTALNEVIAVDTGTGAITLIAKLGVPTPAKTRIVAVREVNLDNNLTSDRILRITAGMSNKFAVIPASEPVYVPAAAPTTYLDVEVFLLKPDWSQPVTEQFDWTVEVIDYGWGVQQRYPISPRQTRTIKARYWDNGSEKCLLVADFFQRMLGMQGEFFMPTFDNDLPLRTGILSGQNTIRVIGTSTSIAINNGFPFEHLAIKLTDGTYVFAGIISVTIMTDSLGSDTLIEIDHAMTAHPLDTILMVSWMPIWRFASDQLSMEWMSDEVAIATINIQTRPYLSGSTP